MADNFFKVRKGLIVNGSGSTIFDIQGSQGQLFSVTDQLSGSLFSVNDISGTPVLEAFSDDTVKLGTYQDEAIIVTGSRAIIQDLEATGSYTGSFTGDGSQLTNLPLVTTTPSFIKLLSNDTTTDFNTGTNEPIPWDVVDINETGSVISHSTTSNNTRITVNTTGYYKIIFNARLTSGGDREAPQFGILKNGINLIEGDRVSHTYIRDASGHDHSSANFSAVISLSSGDYIEIVNSARDGDTASVFLTRNTSLVVEKFEIGAKGEKGDTGDPTTSTLQDVTDNGSTTDNDVTLQSSLAVGNISPSGTTGRIDASNDVVAFSSSDKRWKKNTTPLNNPIEKILSISGVEFDWIEDTKVHGNKGHDVGIIAQEVEKVLPEAVQTREDTGMKAVRYEKLIPLLIETVKDQQKQIEGLKQKIKQ